MIRFPCRCGYVFNEPDDAAGDEIQCPRCGLLNDVPLHGDRSALTDDGIYRVDQSPAAAAGLGLDGLIDTFSISRNDGNAVDKRATVESLEAVGEADSAETQKRRQRPRYDPETGERIDAIPLSDERRLTAAEPAIPVPVAEVSYAANGTIAPVTIRHVLESLLRPVNLVVMSFIFGLYIAAAISTGITLCGIFILAPGVLAMVAAILAHYGDVVDEIGPQNMDELPRPLRDFELWEDIVLPLYTLLASLAVCFGLSGIVLLVLPGPLAMLVATVFALVGFYFFPAIFLTLHTSGSIGNLLPNRVMKVIAVIEPARYFRIVAVLAITCVVHAWLILGVIEIGWGMVHAPLLGLPNWVTSVPLLLTMAVIGVFTMHLFCWTLGLIYRHSHQQFGWEGQVYVPEEKPPVPRRKPTYVNVPPVE